MIPLRDENPPRRTPVVTYLFIAMNVLVFAWQVTTPERVQTGYMMVPAEITHNVDVVSRSLGPSLQPLYLTMFTAMFMHGGFMHIAGNMLYLWIFGDNVEDMLGHGMYLIFYLACGVAASAAHILFAVNSTVPTLGASGAVAGVLGAYLVTHPRASVLSILILGFFWQTIWLPAWLVLGGWFLLQIFGQFGTWASAAQGGGGVAYMAHIGGFVAGMFLLPLLGGKKSREAPSRRDEWETYRGGYGGNRRW